MGDLKEFVLGIMGAGRCEICSSGWELRQDFYVAVLRQKSSFSGKAQILFLRPSVDWMKQTRLSRVIFFI